MIRQFVQMLLCSKNRQELAAAVNLDVRTRVKPPG